MTLDDLSKDIYVLNLKPRLDRRTHIISELKKISCLNYNLFDAIDGSTLENKTKLKPGMLGLITTYLKIYDEWIKNDPKDILIIEDDCVFVDDFNNKLSLYFKNLPDNWDMVYFGANHNYHMGSKTKEINDYCIKLNNSYSAHCVLLKSYVFKELINKIKNFNVENDVMLAKLQTTYNAYSSKDTLTSQISSFSNIENKVVDYKWLIK